MQKTKKLKIVSVAIALTAVFLTGAAFPVLPAEASVSRLQSRIDNLNSNISESQNRISGLRDRQDTLQNRIEIIKAEIDEISQQLGLTAASIEKTNQELTETRGRIDTNLRLIRENSRILYKNGNPNIIEVLFSSDNFSAFVNRYEYLSSVRESTNRALRENEAAKVKLEEKKDELANLELQQKAQRTVAQDKRSEQQELLEKTRGEERRYQGIVTDQRQQRTAALAAMDRIRDCVIQGGNWDDTSGRCVMPPPPPPDPAPSRNQTGSPAAPSTPAPRGGSSVSRGQVIGAMGSTGFSTGPHLHFEVITGGGVVNPVASGRTLINGFIWPVGGSGGTVTQNFGCSSIQYSTTSPGCPGNRPFLHTGLDIAGPIGMPIRAAAAGTVRYRGYNGGYGNMVIIDHPGGYSTLYAHMHSLY